MKRWPKPSISVGAGVLALAFCLLTSCAIVKPNVVADFPAREAPNYQSLVSVSWLKGLLDYQQSGFETPRPATYHNKRFTILEASWATLEKAQDYRNGHIPGATHFSTDDLENGSPRWRLRDAKELQRAIGRAGITPDTTVIVYGGKLIAAARVWWCVEMILYCGGGWRSSVAFFYAWLLGFENVRNYSDGWSGWSTEYHADPAAQAPTPGWRQQPSSNPIETGAPRSRWALAPEALAWLTPRSSSALRPRWPWRSPKSKP